jgi:hypothetical protein
MKFSTMCFTSILLLGSAGIGFAQTPDNSAQASPGMSSGPATAAGGGGRMAACREDANKYCSGKTGADRRECLTTNMSSLSDGCKIAMAAAPAAGTTAPPANQ